MKTNPLKTSLVGLALVALFGAPTAIGSEVQTHPAPQVVTWNWLPTSADAFLNGAVGDVCNGSSYQLSETELREFFPEFQPGDEQSSAFRSVGGCENNCACGGCVVINGQTACTACYACCPPDTPCKAECKADLQGFVVATCTCGGGLASVPEAKDEPAPSLALDLNEVTSHAPHL